VRQLLELTKGALGAPLKASPAPGHDGGVGVSVEKEEARCEAVVDPATRVDLVADDAEPVAQVDGVWSELVVYTKYLV
jgi:hypothetical protein